MKSDYLWDKSGAPDPEIARLEQALSVLRQPQGRPAWLQEFMAEQDAAATPQMTPFVPRRRWWQVFRMPQLAFATVALCALAGGLWFNATRHTPTENAPRVATVQATPQTTADAPPIVVPVEDAAPKHRVVVAQTSRRVTVARALPVRVKAVRTVAAPAKIARQPVSPPADEVTPEEARKAQADLALALRVINDKLNQAQKSMEGRALKLPELDGESR